MTTTTATAARLTYRKTAKGEWVAYGPASALSAGAQVIVYRKSGEGKPETIERVGRSFEVNGEQMAYGYLAPKATPSQRAWSGRRSSTYSCQECEWNSDAGDMRGCSRHRGNPQN